MRCAADARLARRAAKAPKQERPIVHEPAVLEESGSSAGEVKLVKQGEVIVAHQVRRSPPFLAQSWRCDTDERCRAQWDGSKWEELGEVVEPAEAAPDSAAPARPPQSKMEHDGKEYDYVFGIDIKDDEEPLQLPYNLEGASVSLSLPAFSLAISASPPPSHQLMSLLCARRRPARRRHRLCRPARPPRLVPRADRRLHPRLDCMTTTSFFTYSSRRRARSARGAHARYSTSLRLSPFEFPLSGGGGRYRVASHLRPSSLFATFFCADLYSPREPSLTRSPSLSAKIALAAVFRCFPSLSCSLASASASPCSDPTRPTSASSPAPPRWHLQASRRAAPPHPRRLQSPRPSSVRSAATRPTRPGRAAPRPRPRPSPRAATPGLPSARARSRARA